MRLNAMEGGTACAGTACAGTECAGTECAGTECAGTECAGTECAGTECAGTECAGTECAGTACAGTECAGTECAGTECAGTACAGTACALPAAAEELLKEIESAFRETSHVPDHLLLALKFVFGASAIPALDLVDRQSVTRLSSPSGRAAYQVSGSSGKLYTCFASCHFCSCPAFTFGVLRKGQALLCKHLLAVYLSRALGACQELSVSEQQLSRLLLPPQEDAGGGEGAP